MYIIVINRKKEKFQILFYLYFLFLKYSFISVINNILFIIFEVNIEYILSLCILFFHLVLYFTNIHYLHLCESVTVKFDNEESLILVVIDRVETLIVIPSSKSSISFKTKSSSFCCSLIVNLTSFSSSNNAFAVAFQSINSVAELKASLLPTFFLFL